MNNVEWFDFISEVTDDIITRHTLGGLFLQVSRKAITSFGYPLEEIISQSPYSFIHEDDIAVVKNNHTFLINERKSEWVKYRLKCKNGDYLSLQSYGKLIHSTLDPLGYEIILYTKILDDDDFEMAENRIQSTENEQVHCHVQISSFDTQQNVRSKSIIRKNAPFNPADV